VPYVGVRDGCYYWNPVSHEACWEWPAHHLPVPMSAYDPDLDEPGFAPPIDARAALRPIAALLVQRAVVRAERAAWTRFQQSTNRNRQLTASERARFFLPLLTVGQRVSYLRRPDHICQATIIAISPAVPNAYTRRPDQVSFTTYQLHIAGAKGILHQYPDTTIWAVANDLDPTPITQQQIMTRIIDEIYEVDRLRRVHLRNLAVARLRASIPPIQMALLDALVEPDRYGNPPPNDVAPAPMRHVPWRPPAVAVSHERASSAPPPPQCFRRSPSPSFQLSSFL